MGGGFSIPGVLGGVVDGVSSSLMHFGGAVASAVTYFLLNHHHDRNNKKFDRRLSLATAAATTTTNMDVVRSQYQADDVDTFAQVENVDNDGDNEGDEMKMLNMIWKSRALLTTSNYQECCKDSHSGWLSIQHGTLSSKPQSVGVTSRTRMTSGQHGQMVSMDESVGSHSDDAVQTRKRSNVWENGIEVELFDPFASDDPTRTKNEVARGDSSELFQLDKAMALESTWMDDTSFTSMDGSTTGSSRSVSASAALHVVARPQRHTSKWKINTNRRGNKKKKLCRK